jgi:hypothetical protein
MAERRNDSLVARQAAWRPFSVKLQITIIFLPIVR